MKKALSIFLTAVMLLFSIHIIGFFPFFHADASEIILFGSYPQSKVTDNQLISELNSQNVSISYYPYYINGSRSNFMSYGDVEYNGSTYRKVFFSSYRPYWNRNPSSYNEQSNNGYKTNTTYWFKYEPLQWEILDRSIGLVLCKNIIDSTYFNVTDSYSGWSSSYMRSWLNTTFYSTAFSNTEKQNIKATNGDYVFLLSYSQVTDTGYGYGAYNVKDSNRAKTGTDYALCQGLWNSNRYGDWWLSTNTQSRIVNYNGDLVNYGNVTSDGVTSLGVCPAVCIEAVSNGDVLDGDESWKTDSVKIEFRYADSKKIVDYGEHIADAEVGMSFTSSDGVNEHKSAKKGIMYLGDYCFPLVYIKASWQSAFGGGEYSYTSNKTVNAKAGDTIVIYMSTNANNGSVAIKSTQGVKNNYGAANADGSIEGFIQQYAKEFEDAINAYLRLFYSKKTSTSTISLNEQKKDAIKNASNKEKIYAISMGNKDVEDAACYAIADVFLEKTKNNINLGSLDLNKSETENALILTTKLLNNFGGTVCKSGVYGKYFVDLKITYYLKDGFSGDFQVYKIAKQQVKGKQVKGAQVGFGMINSSVSGAENTVCSFFKACSEYVNTALKQSLASVFNAVADATKLNTFVENQLSDTVKNALSYLESHGYGKVKDTIVKAKKIYCDSKSIVKNLASTIGKKNKPLKDRVNEILGSDKQIREIYDIVKGNSFSSEKIDEEIVKKAVSNLESARKNLYNALYNKLYGIDRDDTDLVTAIWKSVTKGSLKCPVDVEVYDADGELIAYVDTLGRHEEYIYYSGDVYIETEGDEKYIYYPSDKEVSFLFYGTEQGEMTYTLERLYEGESVERLNYYHVPLEFGEVYLQTVPASADLSALSENLCITGTSDIYADEYLFNEDETAHVRVLYSATDGGSADGDVYYPKGDCATLYAYPEDGYHFSGWYLNDECVSEDVIYRFPANEDVFLEARFEEAENSDGEENQPVELEYYVLTETESVLEKGQQLPLLYLAVPSTAETNVVWRSSNTAVATVDQNGVVTAVEKGETDIIICDSEKTEITAVCHIVVSNQAGIEDPDGQQTGAECQYCGKVHPSNFIGKITKFFHSVLYFFAHLFGKM